jgi:hypothetical protein
MITVHRNLCHRDEATVVVDPKGLVFSIDADGHTPVAHIMQAKVYLRTFAICLPLEDSDPLDENRDEIELGKHKELRDRFAEKAKFCAAQHCSATANYKDDKYTGVILFRTPPTSIYIEEIGKFYHYAVGAVMATVGEVSLEHLR